MIKKKPVESFEKMKGQLELKVKRDSRSKLISDAFVNNLKTYYKVEDNEEALDYFNTIVTDSFYKRTWAVPQFINTGKIINTIGDLLGSP